MDASLLARFAAACGADGPLDLVVEREDGVVAAHGQLDQPFAVLGRESFCDVQLNDPDVAPRHAFLQVIGGQVFVGDLGSETGLVWPNGRHPFGWLVPGEPVQVGPFRVYLARPASARTPAFGPTFHPLAAGPDLPPGLPPVAVEFRNGKAARPAWDVNRVLTLIGRAKECKLQLAGDDVSLYHGYLLWAADGLWVVDLLGRGGLLVGGIPSRLAKLEHDDEVQVGRFVLGIAYPPPPGPDDGLVSFDVPTTLWGRPAARPPACAALPAHVPGGTGSTRMVPADALTWPGPLAQPVDPTDLAPPEALPADTPPPRFTQTPPPSPPPAAEAVVEVAAEPTSPQLVERQGEAFAALRQSLAKLAVAVGPAHPEPLAAVWQDFGRLEELHAELLKALTPPAAP